MIKKTGLLTILLLSFGLILIGCGSSGGGGNKTTTTETTIPYIAHFIAVGEAGTIVHSEDGDTWTPVASGTGNGSLVSIGYGNGRLVAVGDGGIILYSDNGEDWSLSAVMQCGCTLNGVAYGDGLWIAVGDKGEISKMGTIAKSSDGGKTWTTVKSEVYEQLRGIAYGNGLWVAVGNDGTIIYSTDGDTWRAAVSSSDVGGKVLYAVAYGDEWVAVGESTAIKSADGTDWSLFDPDNSPSENDILAGVAYGNGLWVGVGKSTDDQNNPIGIIGNSNNDESYELSGKPFAGVTYGNGTWIAVGFDGTIVKSTDGSAWSPVTSGTDKGLTAVAFRPSSI